MNKKDFFNPKWEHFAFPSKNGYYPRKIYPYGYWSDVSMLFIRKKVENIFYMGIIYVYTVETLFRINTANE